MGDWIKKRPQESDGIESVVVVDNIPQVAPKLVEKLKKVITKIYCEFGHIQNEYYPIDEKTNKTKGYVSCNYIESNFHVQT